MEQTELEKGMNGRDALDNEGGEVGALLGWLRRVEAPGDFEFGVRARIAAREEIKPRTGLFPFLKLAAPLALLLVVTGFVFFYATLPTADGPVVVGSPQSSAPTSEDAPASPDRVAEVAPPETSNSRLTESAAASIPGEAVARRRTAGPVRTANNNKRPTSRGGSVDMPLSGSFDRTLGIANSIVPRGFESANPGRSANANIRSGTEVPVREMLGILGISAEFVDSEWAVRSVADNSLGVRAGFRAGDVIEVIDGIRVTGDTKLKGDSAGKAFGIRRSGKRIDLTIGN